MTDKPVVEGIVHRPTIFVLTISHRHGGDIYVHQTREGAERNLEGYCRMWWEEAAWNDEDDGEDPAEPEDPTELITRYFSLMEDESYSIEEEPLGA